jgi:hypothetical protein
MQLMLLACLALVLQSSTAAWLLLAGIWLPAAVVVLL